VRNPPKLEGGVDQEKLPPFKPPFKPPLKPLMSRSFQADQQEPKRRPCVYQVTNPLIATKLPRSQNRFAEQLATMSFTIRPSDSLLTHGVFSHLTCHFVKVALFFLIFGELHVLVARATASIPFVKHFKYLSVTIKAICTLIKFGPCTAFLCLF